MVLGYTEGLALAGVVLEDLVEGAADAAALAHAIQDHPYTTFFRTALCQLVSEADRRAE